MQVVLPRLQRKSQEALAGRLDKLKRLVRARHRGRKASTVAEATPLHAMDDRVTAEEAADSSDSDTDDSASPPTAASASTDASLASATATATTSSSLRRRGGVLVTDVPVSVETSALAAAADAGGRKYSAHSEAYIALAAEEGLLPAYTTTAVRCTGPAEREQTCT